MFKERFKVLKQISGRIECTIRRWYRYCSTCSVWLRMRAWGLCTCCGKKLRVKKRDSNRLSRGKRYYRNNKEKCKANYRRWVALHPRTEYKRQYNLRKKLELT